VPSIVADATQMHQVLMNLCINARDAMPKGGALTISTFVEGVEKVAARFPRASAFRYVVIQVVDTGMGMDAETQRRIFEPFFTTKGAGKGTGLGLSLVYSIVERHQGHIDVKSILNGGTVFSVFMPIEERAPGPEQLVDQSLAHVAGGKETVLVIEDEEMISEMVTTILTSKGYSVLTARDGEEGVAMFMSHRKKVAIVLSDFGLPKYGGEEVLHRIKAADSHAKVILSSGALEPLRRTELREAGAAGFLLKPYLPSDVARIIRSVIDAPPGG
jgi:CheY-like chemotaxis protein